MTGDRLFLDEVKSADQKKAACGVESSVQVRKYAQKLHR
jgi:hypothetical protein